MKETRKNMPPNKHSNHWSKWVNKKSTKVCSPKTDYKTNNHFSCPSFHANVKNISCQSYNVKMLKSFQSYNKKQFEIYSHKKIAQHYYETNNHLPCHTFIPM